MSNFLPYKDTPLFKDLIGVASQELIAEFDPKKYGIGTVKDIERSIEPSEKESVESVSGIYTADKLIERKIEEIPKLLDPLFPSVGVVAVAGGSDTGKSSLLRELCIRVVAKALEYIGLKLNTRYQRCIYVSTEDDDMAVSFLLNKANKKLNYQPKQLAGLKFIFDTSNLLDKLENELSKEPVDVIVIDTFSDLYGKSINETNQVRTFLNQFSQLAQKYKCLIIFLHHTGKKTELLVPSKNNLLGSQGFEAKMRMVMELRLDPVDASKRHLCVVKGNYLPRENKTESYVLIFNDNLLFTMTDERRPFDELKASDKSGAKEQVKELSSEGKSQKEIAKIIGISQPTVSRYLKE
jgi:archaellum biogenesis ATPase FlaH